jgi:curved DNA-binding protein CbpA
MGNFISKGDNEISVIKKLYQLSKPELDVVHSHLKKETFSNIEIGFIHSLRNKNNTLKNKIPDNKYNIVHYFLEHIGKTEETEKKYTKKEMLSVFKLSNTYKYTEDELKVSYKKLAMRYHPDRPNGDNDKFQLITTFYLALMEDIKLQKEDKQFTELKTGSQDFITQQTSNNKKNTKLNHFEPKIFNKIFEETKIEEEDDGYKEWMENTKKPDKDIEKNTKLSGNFNTTSFNSTFEEEIEHPKEIVEYKIPEGIFSSSSIQPQELGSIKKNYTTTRYSDFKEAHTTPRIGGTNTRESFNNLDELQSKRANIVKLTEKELEELAKYDMSKKKMDEERILNLKRKDEMHFSNYNRIHDRMIDNSFLR